VRLTFGVRTRVDADFQAGVSSKLFEETMHMTTYRRHRNVKACRDLLVTEAFPDQCQHLPFTVRELHCARVVTAAVP